MTELKCMHPNCAGHEWASWCLDCGERWEMRTPEYTTVGPLPTSQPQPFVTRFACNYQQHSKRIATMLAEGLHDGKAWKPEAHDRYAALEVLDQRTAKETVQVPARNYTASESRLREGLRELAERVNLLLEWMPTCSVGSSGHSRRIAVEESLRALLENREGGNGENSK